MLYQVTEPDFSIMLEDADPIKGFLCIFVDENNVLAQLDTVLSTLTINGITHNMQYHNCVVPYQHLEKFIDGMWCYNTSWSPALTLRCTFHIVPKEGSILPHVLYINGVYDVRHNMPHIVRETVSLQDTCPICLDEFDSFVRLRCAHIVCRTCLSAQLLSGLNSCGLCRAIIDHIIPGAENMDLQECINAQINYEEIRIPGTLSWMWYV